MLSDSSTSHVHLPWIGARVSRRKSSSLRFMLYACEHCRTALHCVFEHKFQHPLCRSCEKPYWLKSLLCSAFVRRLSEQKLLALELRWNALKCWQTTKKKESIECIRWSAKTNKCWLKDCDCLHNSLERLSHGFTTHLWRQIALIKQTFNFQPTTINVDVDDVTRWFLN